MIEAGQRSPEFFWGGTIWAHEHKVIRMDSSTGYSTTPIAFCENPQTAEAFVHLYQNKELLNQIIRMNIMESVMGIANDCLKSGRSVSDLHKRLELFSRDIQNEA